MAPRASVGLFKQVWKAIKQLNPTTVRQEAERPLNVGIIGSDAEIDAVVAWLTQGESLGIFGGLVRRFDLVAAQSADKPARRCDLVICATSCWADDLEVPLYRFYTWSSSEPEKTLHAILDEEKLGSLQLALAHRFKVFRKEVNQRIIRTVSLENAAFVASTAIGNIIPNPLAPLASVAEAAGDTAVLTANQVRMLFRLAAANRKPVGYKELMPQIGSIVAAGLGWRAVARQLVGKIPLGGGLVAKSAVGYAGTWTVGEGIALFFTTGRKMTKDESKQRFQEVMVEARQVAIQIAANAMDRVRSLRQKTAG